ncbi:MAG TPA: hypothetical protein PKL73_13185 [Polyangiaceae bacterium]|nr:MAG: hypothetical protein BWY17_02877 [Deltaproteobacteria bacterium ADurb.Bin207]HNS97897.1 hypothetical protein [Polyangiaceae bacterium]HOE50536.1 hypothetical protein [Polyangiaceae bacterium]HOH01578.1 hypothetical protein [Polyangiaceae bacterium]HOR35413.1 hypothetical protein [Polyangiaceae bacterium]
MSWRANTTRGFMSRMMIGAWLSLAAVGVSDVARAQSEEEVAKAREQFRLGVQLEAAGDWAGALAQFEAVARVRMTPAVRFHIARCQHHLGSLLEALGGYRLAAHEAEQDPKAQETLTEAQAGIAEVEAKIPKLTIELGAGAEAASVTLDGVALGDASVGKEVPVNPGAHTIRYTLPGGKVHQRIVRLKEGESKKVVLADSAADVVEPDTKDDASVRTEDSGSNVLPWVMIGVGGASLVTSGVFYLMRSSTIQDHEDQCVGNVCPRSLEDTGDKGKTYGMVGNITLGVGLVGVGVGTIMLLAGGSSSTETAGQTGQAASNLTVLIGGSGRGAEAALVGTF